MEWYLLPQITNVKKGGIFFFLQNITNINSVKASLIRSVVIINAWLHHTLGRAECAPAASQVFRGCHHTVRGLLGRWAKVHNDRASRPWWVWGRVGMSSTTSGLVLHQPVLVPETELATPSFVPLWILMGKVTGTGPLCCVFGMYVCLVSSQDCGCL